MRCVLIPAAAALLALSASAQQFVELPKAHLPSIQEGVAVVAAGDVDGDGDVDLIVDPQVHSPRLWRNDGNARFAEATTVALSVIQAGVLADLDGDGDLDLAIVGAVLLNDGAGTFTVASVLPSGGIARGVAVADVDGDGDLDIAVATGDDESGAPNRLFLNDGSARFVDASANLPALSGDSRSVAFGDVDGDGDPDLVFGNHLTNHVGTYGEFDELYLNDGSGIFTDASSQLVLVSAITHAVALADVDGDGDLDLISANSDGNRIDVNDGSGRFATSPVALPGASTADGLSVGDVDGDGAIDLFFLDLRSGGSLAHEALYLNDGTGTFVDASAMLPSGGGASTAVLADVDGDRDRDIVTGSLAGPHLYLNGGSAFFDGSACHLPVDFGERNPYVVLGDLDGDGDLEIVEPDKVCDNDGRGWFSERPFAGRGNRLALADVDGDGDLDLLMSSRYAAGEDTLYVNDGHGGLTPAPTALPAVAHPVLRAAFGDVDGDGDPDLALATTAQTVLLINDGVGVFNDESSGRLPVDPQSANNAAFGDVDGDGDLDLVLGGWNTRLYLNDGAGVFRDVTATQLPGGPTNTSVFLGDVDADGDLDLVYANSGQDRQNRLYLNDGAGTFTDVTATGLPLDTHNTTMVALADVDGDGDLDLYCANGLQYVEESNSLWLNDGRGHFIDASDRLATDVATTVAVAAGDVDGDGDIDLACAEPYPSWSRLWLNLQRQLEAPYLLVAGDTWTLTVHARPGFSPLFQLVLPIVSAGPANVPLPPFGTFGLDPLRMVTLPWLYVAPPGGKVDTVIPVPPDPGLAGVPVFAQAVVMSPAEVAHLTNVVVDRMLR